MNNSIIPYEVKSSYTQGLMEKTTEEKQFSQANSMRVDALLSAIRAGEHFSKIKKIMLNAPNKREIVTDMGTFKGWNDFCEKNNIQRSSIDRLIFMYEHRQEFKEMRLISKDPCDLINGISGHRKIAACDAVKWYLKLIKEKGEGVRGTVTAADYQAHRTKLAEVGAQAVDSINLKLEHYFSLMAKLQSLEKENKELKAKLPLVL